MTGPGPQVCSTPGCANEAAFRTRTKPAWCNSCIDQILREGALAPAEPFTGPRAPRLTTCLACGIQAHYTLEYTIAKNAVGEKTCRACFWVEWAKRARDTAREPNHPLSRQAIINHLDACGYDFLSTVLAETDIHTPVVGRCRACGKIQAARWGDYSWGCECSRNQRSIRPAERREARGTLLAESGAASLGWWDHERNDPASLATATTRAARTAHWVCPACGLRFTEQVYRMAKNPACPQCSTRQRDQRDREWSRWRRTPARDVPDLAAAWADPADPATVMVADQRQYQFQCLKGHHPRVRPLSFLNDGCQFCRAAKARKQWLADVSPEIASQWHPARNGRHTPHDTVWDSRRQVWWRSDCCGHEWQESPRFRDKYERLRCPACRSILGSLAWVDPGLALEWSPRNPCSPWHVRPHADPGFVPEWVCTTDPTHVWQALLSSRSNGAACPECSQAGKSRIELDYHQAAEKAFGAARSGAILRDAAFTTRQSWTADITVTVNAQTVVIEYDGAYWHAPAAKELVDERKTLDLLAAGYRVVRLREHPLPMLNIKHPHLLQTRVYPTAPRPGRAMNRITAWLTENLAVRSACELAMTESAGDRPGGQDRPGDAITAQTGRRNHESAHLRFSLRGTTCADVGLGPFLRGT